MKKYLALVMAFLLVISILAGCSVKDGDNGNKDDKKDAKGDNPVIAKVGENSLYYNDFKTEFDSYYNYYVQSGYDFGNDEEFHSFADYILDILVSEMVVKEKIKEYGLDNLTKEQQQELDKIIEDEINEMYDYYRTQAESEKENDETVDVDSRIAELIEEEAKYYMGDDATKDSYIENMKNDAKTDYLYQLLVDKIHSTVKVDDDEVEKWYNDKVEEYKTKYAENPEKYMDDVSAYDEGESEIIVYVPSGYYRYYDIYVPLDEETKKSHDDDLKTLESLIKEYGTLALDDADKNSERLEEIKNQYNEIKSKLNEDMKGEAKDKIDEAMAALEKGIDFKTVMLEYTQNKSFTEGVGMEKGLVISNEYKSSSISDEVYEAFAKLNDNEYSQIIQDNDGFHIIYRIGEEKAGEVGIESVKEDIRASLLEEKKNEEWSETLRIWLDDKELVTLYSDEMYKLLDEDRADG